MLRRERQQAFNSRAREGATSARRSVVAMVCPFNSRAREGATEQRAAEAKARELSIRAPVRARLSRVARLRP